MSVVFDVPEWINKFDMTGLSQEGASDYLRELTDVVGLSFDSWDDSDKLSYIAKVQEVKKYLASFPVTL